MEYFQLTQLEDHYRWTTRLKRWLPRIAAALLFFFIGVSKFGRQSRWITTFEQIGFGQWFRYATGVLQTVGAVAILIPRVFLLGFIMLASTMLGAMLAWVLLLRAPFNAIFPGALLLGLTVVAAEDLANLLPTATTEGRLNSTDSTEQIVGRKPL